MKKIIYTLVSFMPVLTFAAVSFNGIGDLANSLTNVINRVIPFLFALAIIYFFWGLIQFIAGGSDPKKHEEGKRHMIYGILAIAIMASVFGLVSWLQTTFGITGGERIILPSVPTTVN
jgi:hypothetical protein